MNASQAVVLSVPSAFSVAQPRPNSSLRLLLSLPVCAIACRISFIAVPAVEPGVPNV